MKIKISSVTIQAAQLWSACIALLVAHAWMYLPRADFWTGGVLYPTLVSIGVGAFVLFTPGTGDEVPDQEVPQAWVLPLILGPVFMSIAACIAAHAIGSFEEVLWVLMAVSAGTGQQIGALMKTASGGDGGA